MSGQGQPIGHRLARTWA